MNWLSAPKMQLKLENLGRQGNGLPPVTMVTFNDSFLTPIVYIFFLFFRFNNSQA
jgi:hypothetical protein